MHQATAESVTGERWGVVGGGVLGLTLALRLAQRGHSVTLFEAADRLGGVADAWRLGDIRWDRHYHVICLSDSVLRDLLSELGLEHQIEWVETRTGFFSGSKLVSISSNIDILRNLPLSLFHKARLGLTISYISSLRDGLPLEQIPVADWLTKLSGRRVFERLWLPLLKAKLGDNYRVASAAFIWAVVRRLSKARRMGLDKERFGYVPGGYGRVLDQCSAALADEGVDIRLGAPIERVEATPDGIEVESRQGETFQFDQVAVTLPAPLAAKVCRGLSGAEVDRLEGITYQGIVCASILLSQPLAEYYLTYITDPEVPFSAVVEMSGLVDAARHFGGQSLVYLPKYVRSDDPLLDAPDSEIEASFLAGLERMYPEFDRSHVSSFRISRVRHLLALSTLGYSDRLPPITTSVRGVHIVNSAHIVNGTLNVNETMQLAETAAARIGDFQPSTVVIGNETDTVVMEDLQL
ncbi:MAG: NAD(P)/FAD-dependent oxidoreductase [Acidobacteriota bacterium]